MKLDEIDVFQMYLAIKLHFTSEYDFFEYKGKLQSKACTYENLLNKPYHNAIRKLSRLYDSKELCDYFVSNMLVSDGERIFDIDAEGKRVYTDYLRRKESRTYIYKQDTHRVCMELEKINKKQFWDSSSVIDGQHPLLFRMFVGSYLAPETMCILNKIYDFVSDWDKQINDPVFYPVVARQIKKLSPFIKIKDLSPYSEIILNAEQDFLN